MASDHCHQQEKKQLRRTRTPGGPSRILGSDGSFRLVENAMGVPGFHIATNVFSPAVHRRLYECPTFTTNAVPFVERDLERDVPMAVPIQQTILHPVKIGPNGPWPDDWHQIINAVRDCGLFAQATIPDCGYGLTYRKGSMFPCHWDGRGKWGEYVICCTLGAPCTITFQHTAPKKNPVDPSRPSDWVPPDPDTIEGSYWTRSEKEARLSNHNPETRRLWQLTMTLPPNSLYVMSGPSRYDWRHGINCDGNHPVPTPTSSYISASGAVTQVPASTWLFPSWNKSGARRSVIFRSTKCFSDLCLQEEKDKALDDADYGALIAINRRIDDAHRFKPQDMLASRNLTEEEIRDKRKEGEALIKELKRSCVHRLRFDPSEVMFDALSIARAAGDVDAAPHDHSEDVAGANSGRSTGTSVGGQQQQNVRAEAEVFTGPGRRLGETWEQEVTKKGARAGGKSDVEVISLLDSDDEADEQKNAKSDTLPKDKSRIGSAGLAALRRLEASKSSGDVAAAEVASTPNGSAKKEEPATLKSEDGGWECSKCTLLNKPFALQCGACEALAPNATVASTSTVSGIDRRSLSSALAGAFAGTSRADRFAHSNSSFLNADTTDSNSNKRQKLSGQGECYLMGSALVDKNPGAYCSGGWIWCKCPEFAITRPDKSRVDREEDIVAFQQEYRACVQRGERVSQKLILDLAKKHNVVYGKWLLRVAPDSVEEIWPKIRNAVLEGKLASAKIADTLEGDVFMICVYTNDYTNKKEVLRVRQAIHELGIYTRTALYYKPDCITYLDLYTGSKKGVRMTIYSCGGGATKTRPEDYDCTTLMSAEIKCTGTEGCPRCYPKCIGL